MPRCARPQASPCRSAPMRSPATPWWQRFVGCSMSPSSERQAIDAPRRSRPCPMRRKSLRHCGNGSFNPDWEAAVLTHETDLRRASPSAYTGERQELGVTEDERGVDVGHIRTQLRMTVAERVRTMVEAVNVMLAIQQAAQATLQP